MHQKYTVELNERDYTLKCEDRYAKVSYAEFRIIQHFHTNASRYLAKDELVEAGWPHRVVTYNSVTVAIGNLRRALEKVIAVKGDYIITGRNSNAITGYKICPNIVFTVKNEANSDSDGGESQGIIYTDENLYDPFAKDVYLYGRDRKIIMISVFLGFISIVEMVFILYLLM